MTGLVDRLFVGRAPELARLRVALDEARAGHPQLVVLEGPGGIGKTTLLERFLAGENDLAVLRVSGEQWEKPPALRAAGPTRAGREQRRALSSSAAQEPITVGTRLLELWGDLQDERVVVTVIDDAHWADIDSLRALLFAMRRLITDRVLVVVATRDLHTPSMPDGLRRMALGPSGGVLQSGPLTRVKCRSSRTGWSVDHSRQVPRNSCINTLRATPCTCGRSSKRPRGCVAPVGPGTAGAPRVHRRRHPPDGGVPHRAGHSSKRALCSVSTSPSTAAATLSDIDDPLRAVDAATAAGLLESGRGTTWGREVQSPHDAGGRLRPAAAGPASRAARRGGPARRRRSRLAATSGIGRPWRRTHPGRRPGELRHAARRPRVPGPAPRRHWLSSVGSAPPSRSGNSSWSAPSTPWSPAATWSGPSPTPRKSPGFEPSARRDATLGHLAILNGDPAEAEQRLGPPGSTSTRPSIPTCPASLAQRNALHAMGRLRAVGHGRVGAAGDHPGLPDQPESADAHAILGIGLGLVGRADEGLAVHESVLSTASSTGRGPNGLAVRMANGWLRLATDDFTGAAAELSEAAPAALRAGSYRVALYAFTWLARSHFHLGAWDEAIVDADRAVTLLSETEHEWLRPLVHWVAAAVPAARGDWATADQHAAAAAAGNTAYELMIAVRWDGQGPGSGRARRPRRGAARRSNRC